MAELNAESPILFCEGQDDVAFLRWLIDKERIGSIQIAELRGKDDLRRRIRVLLSGIPGRIVPPAIGVVLDADDDPNARRMSIRNALTHTAPGARHGVYVLPGGDEKGMLEDLCLVAGRYRGLITCTTDFSHCARRAYEGRINASKVRYDAYCAVVRPTRMGIREGFNEDEIDTEHPAIRALASFLRELTGEA